MAGSNPFEFINDELAARPSAVIPPSGNLPAGKAMVTTGVGMQTEPGDISAGGAVFVTDVVPTGSGNVTNKVYAPDGVAITQVDSDTGLLTVTVVALTGPSSYKPSVTINGVAVTNFVRGANGDWTGSAAIDLGESALIQCVHADGAEYTATVVMIAALEITNIEFTGGYPVSQTELKEDDEFDVVITADAAFDRVEIQNFEACKVATLTVPSGTTNTVTATIAGRGAGTIPNRTVKLRVRTPAGQWSELFTAGQFHPGVDGQGVVQLNNDVPSVSAIAQGNIDYPVSQAALKDSEGAVVNHIVLFPTGVGTVVYSSPNGDLNISNPSTYETAKSVSRNAGSYNISTTNFRVTAIKTSNQAQYVRDVVVYIAHVACTLAVTEPAARLRSGGNQGTSAQNHVITVTASQRLSQAPTLVAPVGAWQGGGFAGGPTAWTRSLQIHDDDVKGVQAWGAISGVNLAGIETTAIIGDGNYTLGGFVSRTMTIAAWPNREGAIGTQVADTAKLLCTVVEVDTFTFKSSIVDESRKFTITQPTGVYNANGNLWYCCDQGTAVFNTSGTLQVIIEETV